MNDLTAAEASHRQALEIAEDVDPDEAWCNLGLIHRARGDYGAAADAFRRALAIVPDDQAATDALASLDGVADALDCLADLPDPV